MNLYALVFGESVLNDAVSLISVSFFLHYILCLDIYTYIVLFVHWCIPFTVAKTHRWQFLCTGLRYSSSTSNTQQDILYFIMIHKDVYTTSL